MKEIRFTTTKNGKSRAYRYSRPQQRWFPMPLDEAKLAVATGSATDVTKQYAEAVEKYGVYL